jgi:hypothetical protein
VNTLVVKGDPRRRRRTTTTTAGWNPSAFERGRALVKPLWEAMGSPGRPVGPWQHYARDPRDCLSYALCVPGDGWSIVVVVHLGAQSIELRGERDDMPAVVWRSSARLPDVVAFDSDSGEPVDLASLVFPVPPEPEPEPAAVAA